MQLPRTLATILSLTLSSLTIFSTSALAQLDIDELIPDFTPEEASNIGQAFGTFTSATAVFTGRNAVATGNFSFDNDGGDFSVMNIPLTYISGEKGDTLRWQVRGALGRFESRSSITSFFELSEQLRELEPEIFDFPNRPDFRKDESTSLSLGTGVVYSPIAGLEISPAFDFIWTHVRREFDYNNLVSNLLALKFDREVFNNSTESITYSPSLGISYKIDLGCGYSVTPSALYTHLWTEDIWSKSTFAKFSIDSGVFQGQLVGNIPLPFVVISGETDLRPFAKVTNLHGAVKSALEEDTIFDFGADIAFDLEDASVKEVSIGAAYVTASSFDGYRLNVSAEW